MFPNGNACPKCHSPSLHASYTIFIDVPIHPETGEHLWKISNLEDGEGLEELNHYSCHECGKLFHMNSGEEIER